MTNNKRDCQSRLLVGKFCVNLRQWFALHLFVLRQYMLGNRQHIYKCCVIQNKRAIVYQTGLALTNPAFFEYLTRFANEYEIYLREDQRVYSIPVLYERRSYPLLITILSLIMIKSAAFADNISTAHVEPSDQQLQEQSVKQLLNWIRFKMSQLDFDVGDEMPKIQRLPRSEMYKLAFGKNMPRVGSGSALNVYGLYNYQDETIYVLDSINLNTIKGKAILLHELVHYLQYQNGHDDMVECRNRLEYLAYRLEASYLKEHGQNIGVSQNHLRRVVQC